MAEMSARYLPQEDGTEEPGFLRGTADTLISAGQGLTGVVKAGADLFGADNPVSETLGDMNKGLGSLYSDHQQQKLERHQQAIREAEINGDWKDEIGAWKDAIVDDPLHYFAQAAGSAGPFAGLRVIGAGAKLGNLSARTVAQGGLGTGVGVGAVKGAQYEAVYNEAVKRGYSDQDAQALATEAQSYSKDNAVDLLAGGGLGLAASLGPMESLAAGRLVPSLTGKGWVKRGLLSGGLYEPVPEGIQGGQEKYAVNSALNRSGFETPQWQGVIGQGFGEAAMSTGPGAVAGVASGYQPTEQEKAAAIEQARIDAQARAQAAVTEYQQGLREEEAAVIEQRRVQETNARRAEAARMLPLTEFAPTFREQEKQRNIQKKALEAEAIQAYGEALASGEAEADLKTFTKQYLEQQGFDSNKRTLEDAYIAELDKIVFSQTDMFGDPRTGMDPLASVSRFPQLSDEQQQQHGLGLVRNPNARQMDFLGQLDMSLEPGYSPVQYGAPVTQHEQGQPDSTTFTQVPITDTLPGARELAEKQAAGTTPVVAPPNAKQSAEPAPKPTTPKQARATVNDGIASGVVPKEQKAELLNLSQANPQAAIDKVEALRQQDTATNVALPTAEEVLQQQATEKPAETVPGVEGDPVAAQELPAVSTGSKLATIPGLSQAESSVAHVLDTASANGDLEQFIRPDGTWNSGALAKAAGLNHRNGNIVVTRTAEKVAAHYGKTVDEVKAALRQRGVERRKVEAADEDRLGLPPEQQRSVVETDELFGENQSMGIIEGVSGVQGAVGERDLEAERMALERPDPVAEQRKAERAAQEESRMDAVLASDEAGEAAKWWDKWKTDGAVSAAGLSKRDAYEWVLNFAEWNLGDISDEQIEADQKDIERRYDGSAPRSLADAPETGGAGGQVAREDGHEGLQPLEQDEATTADEQRDGNADEAQDAERVASDKLGFGDGKLKSVGAQTQGTTRQAVEQVVKDLTGKARNWRVHVFQNEQEAVAAGLLTSKEANGKTQAWVEKGHAYFILGNIPAGNEMAVFLHEVGAHIGLENILTDKQYQRLVNQINAWAKRNDGSKESQIAKAALARVTNAKTQAGDIDAEKIAYFIEEAVKAGINPTANDMKSQLGRFLAEIVRAFRTALMKLGINPNSLTAQDVVNLAYGAAQQELSQNAQGLEQRGKVRSVGPIEQGAGRDAGAESVLQYYAGGKAVGEGAAILGLDSPGTEFVQWEGSYGPYTDVVTLAYVTNDGGYYIVLTTQQLLDAALRKPGAQPTNVLTDAALQTVTVLPVVGRDNVFSASIYGPAKDGAAYDFAASTGGVTDIATPVGNGRTVKNTRLEKIPFSALRQLQKEARRRVTRGNNGRVPNVVTVRTSGAHPGRREFFPSDVVARKFSIAAPTAPQGAFAKAGEMLDGFLTDPKTTLDKMKLGWMTLEQMADRTKLESLRKYIAAIHRMQATSKDKVAEAAKLDAEWAKLSDENAAKLGDVMVRSTLMEYDPTTTAPANNDQVKLKADLAAVPGGEALYKSVRDFYKRINEEKRAVLKDAAKRAGKTTAEVDKMWAEVKGPYFPLMRTGDWYAVAMSDEVSALMDKQDEGTLSKREEQRLAQLRKDPTHYLSKSFQSRSAAEKFATQSGFNNTYVNTQKARIANDVKSMPDFAKLEAYVGKGLDTEARGKLHDMLAEMYYDMLPQTSGLKNQMRREGIHGATFGRSEFARSAVSQAHLISRLKHSEELSEAMVGVDKDARRGGVDARLVYNELQARNALAMDNDAPAAWVDWALKGSYFAHLGVSPAYWLTNATQVPMITMPWLAARHGFGNTRHALATAMADVKDILKTSAVNKDGKLDWRFEFDWKTKFPAGSGEDALFKQLLERNKLDITIENDLMAVADMRHTKLNEAIKFLNTPVRSIELVNRGMTALAAYRLGLKKFDGDQQKAIDHAIKAVNDTQLDYSTLNSARHMQSVLGSKQLARLMMQFRKFQQGMIYLIASNAYDAVKGESDTVKKEARNTLFGLFATTGLMAGSLGLPAAGTVALLANMIGQAFDDDDDPFDAETEWKNFIVRTLGKDVGEVALKGLPAVLNADMSKRIGMGDVLNPVPFFRQGANGRESANNMLAAIAGAPFGTAADTWDGIAKIGNGDYAKGAEKIIPIKLAQNAIRTARYADEGMTDTRNNTILPAEDFSPWDLTLRAMGFQTAEESTAYEAREAVNNAKYAAKDVRTKLLRQLVAGDLNLSSEDVRGFNQRHPGSRITFKTVRDSRRERQRMDKERTSYGVQDSKANADYMDNAAFAEEEETADE
jgi:hypothetical protein